MLILTRKLGEAIHLGKNIIVKVVELDRGKVRLGIEAPKDTLILREELTKKEVGDAAAEPVD